VEEVSKTVKVVFNGVTVAETARAKRVLETGHPPTYYVPPEDVRMEHIEAAAGATSFCEWKGVAQYFDVAVGDGRAKRAVWSYAKPSPAFVAIKDMLAFYAEPMEACSVGGERVRPEASVFYGGWITGDIVDSASDETGNDESGTANDDSGTTD
jgi:uncharacterized protein (DUF427 family)